jgi:hypothetical protein
MKTVSRNQTRSGRVAGTAFAFITIGLALAGCGGGGGSSLFNNFPGGGNGQPSGDFVVESVLPQQGQVWEVNRPITITFSHAVNFNTISPASIAIFQQGTNTAALGTFSLQNPKTVLFQPACPTSTTPAGLQPNGAVYVINITASTQVTSTTIQNTSGDPLKAGKTLTFTTATANNPNDQFDPALFYDPKPNQAPLVSEARFSVVNTDGTVTESTFGNNAIIPGNKFVGPSVFFTLTFDQPLLPSTSNINATNISLRFLNTQTSTYVAIPSKVELAENCTAAGAKVRITPLGLLPGGRKLRIVISQSLTDIKGESSPFALSVPFDPSTEPTVKTPAAGSDFDAICENFDNKANLDINSGFVEPIADWGNGAVQAAFKFAGQTTDFELVVNNGQTLVIDTTAATIQVLDSQQNPQTASFVNGNIYLRKLTVNNGGTIQGQGPNPLRFFVNETVTVQSTAIISVKGIDAQDVSTLLTAGAFPQPGGGGVCGGGDGGLGNPVTSQSCSQGGTGNGSFNSLNGGGIGGESGLVPMSGGSQLCFEVEDWHGAGGGGGSFTTLGEKGRDGCDTNYQTGSCTVAQGVSAVNPNTFPKGGPPGARPFLNATVADDFIGTALVKSAAVVSVPAAGQVKVNSAAFVGASDVGRFVAFYRAQPTQSWEDSAAVCATSGSPEDPAQCFRSRVQVRKITAVSAGDTFSYSTPFLAAPTFNAPTLGDFVVIYGAGSTTQGELTQSLGGQGGGGGGNAIQSATYPNPNYAQQDRKGGGGGGGGGILEIRALGVITILGTLDASGGDGGAGENTIGLDRIGGGGGGGSGGTIILESASQAAAAVVLNAGASSGTIRARGGRRAAGAYGGQKDPVPPSVNTGIGHGGRGGKGLVQIHVPSPDKISFATNQPANANFDPNPIILTTSFGARSRARSNWYDTGAGIAAGLPIYSYGGVCAPNTPACGQTGQVITDSSGNIDTANPVVATNSLLVNATNLTANSITLPLNQVAVVTNPKAVEPLTLIKDLIHVDGNVGSIIAVSQPDSATLILTTDNNTTKNPTALNAGISSGANATWSLVPRFFSVSKVDPVSGVETPNFIVPATVAGGNRVQVQFQGADADANGNVDLSTIVPDPVLVDPIGTSDLTLLTGKRFVRFTVTFDIATVGSVTPANAQPKVDFIKLPFRFN